MIDKETVINVSKLSKLKLTDKEIEIFSKQMADILTFIERLNELDTESVEPFYELIKQPTPLREDIPTESLSQEDALKNAPQKDDGFFVVPRVVG